MRLGSLPEVTWLLNAGLRAGLEPGRLAPASMLLIRLICATRAASRAGSEDLVNPWKFPFS